MAQQCAHARAAYQQAKGRGVEATSSEQPRCMRCTYCRRAGSALAACSGYRAGPQRHLTSAHIPPSLACSAAGCPCSKAHARCTTHRVVSHDALNTLLRLVEGVGDQTELDLIEFDCPQACRVRRCWIGRITFSKCGLC